jgi:phenylalanine-4-hydroxylase
MGPNDLKAYNFCDGKLLFFEFESGIKVEGLNITGIRNAQGKLMLIRLKDCTITYKGEFLFLPEHGIYDMVVGNDITSAFAGSADSNSFPNLYGESLTKTIKKVTSKYRITLEKYYGSIRKYRNESTDDPEFLEDLFKKLTVQYSAEWLLLLEIMEVANKPSLIQSIHDYLEKLIVLHPKLNSLISDGIKMIKY